MPTLLSMPLLHTKHINYLAEKATIPQALKSKTHYKCSFVPGVSPYVHILVTKTKSAMTTDAHKTTNIYNYKVSSSSHTGTNLVTS
jgi:hypothetical protein